MESVQPDMALKVPQRRWPFYCLGLLLFLLGPLIYAVQFRAHVLATPWYAPVLATLGVLSVIVSVRQRPSVPRGAGLALLSLVCAGEWFVLLVGMAAPPYTGVAQVGRPLPAFATSLSDGR